MIRANSGTLEDGLYDFCNNDIILLSLFLSIGRIGQTVTVYTCSGMDTAGFVLSVRPSFAHVNIREGKPTYHARARWRRQHCTLQEDGNGDGEGLGVNLEQVLAQELAKPHRNHSSPKERDKLETRAVIKAFAQRINGPVQRKQPSSIRTLRFTPLRWWARPDSNRGPSGFSGSLL